MPRKQAFLSARWSDQFKASYGRLSSQQQAACDRTIMALIKGRESSGLRVKPVQPAKVYFEARVNQGDRVIFRKEGETILFVDVVHHDDIGRYSRSRS